MKISHQSQNLFYLIPFSGGRVFRWCAGLGRVLFPSIIHTRIHTRVYTHAHGDF